MIIVMKKNATEAQIENVINWVESVGYTTHPSHGVEQTIIGAVGDNRGKENLKFVESLSGVEKTMPILKPYKLASREAGRGQYSQRRSLQTENFTIQFPGHGRGRSEALKKSRR